MRNSSSRLQFQLERLERRLLLAGNVSVVENAVGDFVLLGDAADNEIAIEQAPDGSVRIRGLAGTTLNGESDSIELSASDVFNGNLTIRTRGGGDQIFLGDFTINGTTDINSGGGNDLIELSLVDFEGPTQIRSGGGADQIDIVGSFSSASVAITTGAGNDVANIDSVQWLQGLSVNTGGGNDYLGVNDSNVESFTQIRGGAGDDTVELSGFSSQGGGNLGIQVSLSSGDDNFLLTEFSYLDGDLVVTTGGGDDLVSINSLGMTGDVNLATGGGSDVVAIVNSGVIDALDINLGAGADGLLFGCSRARQMTIQSGGGSDLLLLGGDLDDLDVGTAGGADTVVLNRIDVENSVTMNLGGQSDQLFVSQLSILPTEGVINGGGGSDTVQWDSAIDFQLPLQSVESIPDPQPLDDVVLGGIVVFGTAWVEHGGQASDLVCP